MILDELVLHNFGVYRGRQAIKLTPPARKRPVVLFGGLNGGGKTTLLDGLQLALYGKNAHCSNRGSLGYHDYLERCINTQVPRSEGAGVEIQFRHRSEGKEHRYRVSRTWNATPSGSIREKLQVMWAGDPDDELQLDDVRTELWAEHVEEFMPSGISHLFLFDGEKIESLAEVESSARLLSTAIGSLLGLDLVDQLSTDLTVLERRKRSESKTQGDQDQKRAIEAAQLEVEALTTRVSELVAERGAGQNELDRAEKALKAVEKRFRKEGGETFEQRHVLETRRAAIVEQIERLENELRTIAEEVAPLAVVQDLVEVVARQDQAERQSGEARALAEVLSERDRALAGELKKRGAPQELTRWLTDYLKKDRADRAGGATTEPYLELSSDAHTVLTMVPGALRDARERARTLMTELDKQRAALDQLDRHLAAVPSSDAIAALQEERDQARERVAAARARRKGLESELERTRNLHKQKKSKLGRLLEKKAKAGFADEDARRVVHHAKRVRGTLAMFREKLVERHVRRIERLILDSFRQLLRKEALVSNLAIDPRTFAVELRDRNGDVLAPSRLSAGERQLLAVSMLWGLARASGRPLPAVIDTPLGRLDSTHREKLIKRYFPYASHQVLLLSTDEEIDARYFDQLKPMSAGRISWSSTTRKDRRRSAKATSGRQLRVYPYLLEIYLILMSLDHIKLSQQARDQLITLKRRTGIKHWNTLCRWAFCTSLAESSEPPDADIPADSNVEMTWKTFGGEYRDIYRALLVERCRRAGLELDEDVLSRQFRLHLHRGIGYLAADRSMKGIEDLVARALD